MAMPRSVPCVVRMSDHRELLSRWRAGDNAAGRALFSIFGPALAGYFQRKLFDTSEVRALVNATFYACIATKTPYDGQSDTVRSYLFGIAHNKLREYLRRVQTADRQVDQSLGSDDLDQLTLHQLDPRDPSEFVEHQEERKLILKALRRIPLGYQMILELSFWENLSNREIADALGVPVGTVASRLRLGKEQLERQVQALARTPALLQTTTMTLSAWIEQVHAQVGPKAGGARLPAG